MRKKLPFILRLLVSALFLLSAVAKLYPFELMKGLKYFEEGQLIPMGFSEGMAPYFSRFIIAIEFFIAVVILQKNYIRRIVIPGSVFLLVMFSLHLVYQVFTAGGENCGCFGELIPMTPLQALIKNLITIGVLLFIYRQTKDKKTNNISKLIIQFLILLLLMFAFLPIQKMGKNKRVSNFSEYIVSDIDINSGKKILCFFDAGCDHCMEAAKSLKELSDSVTNFPAVHVVFSDSEEEKIPFFFDYVGLEFSYQVLPFYNDDDDVNSYLEILGYEYENPVVIYLHDGNQIRFYDGVGVNQYNQLELRKLLE